MYLQMETGKDATINLKTMKLADGSYPVWLSQRFAFDYLRCHYANLFQTYQKDEEQELEATESKEAQRTLITSSASSFTIVTGFC